MEINVASRQFLFSFLLKVNQMAKLEANTEKSGTYYYKVLIVVLSERWEGLRQGG